jgi:hypothetical protein
LRARRADAAARHPRFWRKNATFERIFARRKKILKKKHGARFFFANYLMGPVSSAA